MPAAAPDPSFRQLSRRVNIGSLSSSSSSERPDDQSTPPYSPSADGTSPDTQPSTSRDAGAFGGNGGKPALTRLADASMMQPTAQGFRGIGIPIPVPPMGPVSISQIPMPHIPEWWRIIGAVAQLLPNIVLRQGNGGRDKDQCSERLGRETNTCWARKDEYAHPDYLNGCLERAKERWLKCVKNGGRPSPSELIFPQKSRQG